MYKEKGEEIIKEWWDSASEYYQKEISADKMIDEFKKRDINCIA